MRICQYFRPNFKFIPIKFIKISYFLITQFKIYTFFYYNSLLENVFARILNLEIITQVFIFFLKAIY